MTSAYAGRAAMFSQRAPAWPARNEADVTLSTEEGGMSAAALDIHAGHGDYFDEDTVMDDFRRKAKAMSSPIKGRQGRSNAFEHLSPAIAARHEQLRSRAGLGRSPVRMPLRAEHNDDTESDNESTSSASSASIMGATAPFYNVAESTGNHQGLISSPEARTARRDRPRLDHRALDELDRVSRRGTSARTTRAPMTRTQEKAQYRSPFKPVSTGIAKQTHTGAVDVDPATRKVSSGSSSNGKKHPGTTGSTSGDTLVDDEPGKRQASGKPILLPSGQRMGDGVPSKAFALPDITGMTSALESPVQKRIGVQHKPINQRQMEEVQVNLARTRAHEFDNLAKYIKGVEADLGRAKQNVDHIDDGNRQDAELKEAHYSDMDDWQGEAKPKKHSDRQDRVHSTGEEEEESMCDRKMRRMSHHIAQLDQDLKTYRQEVRDVVRSQEKRSAKAEAKLSRPFFRSYSLPKRTDSDSENEEPSIEEYDILKDQVNIIAREVDRLKVIVNQRDEAHADKAASSPIKPSNGLKAFGLKSFGRTHPFAGSQNRDPAAAPRAKSTRFRKPRVSTTDEDVSDTGEEKVTSQKYGKRREQKELRHSDSEAHLAYKRAEKAMKRVPLQDVQHEAATCAVCGNRRPQDSRKTSSKQRFAPSFERRTSSHRDDGHFDTTQEEIVFDILQRCAPNKQGRALASIGLGRRDRQHIVIKRLLREQKDDFYHFRISYSEMAEELKKIDPSMHPIDRKILADAVIDMVETLEQCATRINLLQSALEADDEGGVSPEVEDEDDDIFISEPEGRHSRQHRHSRRASLGRRSMHNASPIA